MTDGLLIALVTAMLLFTAQVSIAQDVATPPSYPQAAIPQPPTLSLAPRQDVTPYEHLDRILFESDRRYEQRFVAQEKAVAAALISAERAVLKAETASEKRFDSVNEFRKTLSDQTAEFLTRNEYHPAHKALEDQTSANQRRLDILEGRSAGLSTGWVMLGQAVSLVISVVAFVLTLRPARLVAVDPRTTK